MREKKKVCSTGKRGVEICGKVFSTMAGVFSTMACCGKLYETKVPKELRK